MTQTTTIVGHVGGKYFVFHGIIEQAIEAL